MKSSNILVFGAGELQISLINCCKSLNLFVVLIDPNNQAAARDLADVFVVVDGDDFEKTCKVVEEYSISGIVTAATDKPLVMMARIAEKYNFPFYSLQTARNSTDKFLMKGVFQKFGIPCASGKLISSGQDIKRFPVILKPVDNSGSRGVFYCDNKEEVQYYIDQSLSFSKAKQILCEEVLEGQEYSVEAVHAESETSVIQITQKSTTSLPYNVELAHTAPAELGSDQVLEIKQLIDNIGHAFQFRNCISHTELKFTKEGIKIIETSPRLGGDFITSHLVPLSSGINIEEILVKMALRQKFEIPSSQERPSGIFYLNFELGTWIGPENLDLSLFESVIDFSIQLKQNQELPDIKNSLDRYGYVILSAQSMDKVKSEKNRIFKHLSNYVK